MSTRAAFLPAQAPLPLRRVTAHQASRVPSSPRPRPRGHGPARTVVATHNLDYYAQEGIGDIESSLPDAVIYASLRRKAEAMCVDAAIAVCKELAGAGPGLSSAAGAAGAPSSAALGSSLSPRAVVERVLTALRDDPLAAGAVVSKFASESNRFSRCTSETFFHWLSTSEFKYMLDISSYFVAPVPVFGTDFRRCIMSCVVNSASCGRRAVSFNMIKISGPAGDAWLIDSVFDG